MFALTPHVSLPPCPRANLPIYCLQPVVYRWLPHVWGPDPLKHASIVQAVLPTGAGMFGLKTEAQAHRIYNIET